MSDNYFHCVEDEEHVNKTTIADVRALTNYLECLNRRLRDDLHKRAYELLSGDYSNAEIHEFLHKLTEHELNLIESGNVNDINIIRVVMEMSKGDLRYEYYICAVDTNNICGTKQRIALTREEFDNRMLNFEEV